MCSVGICPFKSLSWVGAFRGPITYLLAAGPLVISPKTGVLHRDGSSGQSNAWQQPPNPRRQDILPSQIESVASSVWLVYFSGSWQHPFVLERVELAAVKPGHNIGGRLGKCGPRPTRAAGWTNPAAASSVPGPWFPLDLAGGKAVSWRHCHPDWHGWRPPQNPQVQGQLERDPVKSEYSGQETSPRRVERW